MASECEMCTLLGATAFTDSSNESPMTHAQLHAHQLRLIDHTDFMVGETGARNRIFHWEKSKKSLFRTKKSARLFRISRELAISQSGDSVIKCSQCKNAIRSQRCTKTTARSLINHACIHLNRDLFACRQCDLKFISKGGIHRHLQKFHALGKIRENYMDMTDDHHGDIMDMVKLCFGKAPQKQMTVTAFGKQKKNNPNWTPFSKLALSLLAKYERGDRVQCQLCPTSILNHEMAVSVLVDHVRWHLDKPIFTCHLCQNSASTRSAIVSHLKNVHSVAKSKQNFEDESVEYFEEISSMLEDCFGDTKKERPLVISREEKIKRQNQSSLRTRYGGNSLQAERQLRCSELIQKFNRSGKLECRICHLYLTTYVSASIRHALVHLNKILFNCRRCSYTCKSKAMMGIHVKSKHGVVPKNEYYDRTDDYHSDFMDMLSKCFDWDLEPEKPEGTISRPIVTRKIYPPRIISKMRCSDLKATRHIRASELITNHSIDGKIICRICSHRTPIRGGSSADIFMHAIKHLDKRLWPYRCKLCSYVTTDRAYLRSTHLRMVHKDKDGAEFEDMSDKFHSEIMQILSKSYDYSIEQPTEIS